jgi:hypothetical protein
MPSLLCYTHMNDKPYPKLRDEIINDPIVFLSKDDLKGKHSVTLKKAVEYYESILEVLAGKQVWGILDALALAENELNERKKNYRSYEFHKR